MRLLIILAISLCILSHGSAQPAVPATPADPSQARPATPVTPTPAPTAHVDTAPQQAAVVVSVIADSSLKLALSALAQAWADTQDTGPQVPLSLTNAKTLRTKVEGGPGYDVAISADVADVKALTDKGVFLADGQRSLARNTLVVYGRKALLKEDDLDWYDLIGTEWKKIALGDPENVASGRVAARALKKHDLLDDAHKDLYVYGPTDAIVASSVQGTVADAAFLYRTDAVRLKVPGFEIVPIKTDDAPPVFYTASVCRLAKNPAGARAFIDFCGSPDAKAIWEKFGFETN